MLAVCEFFHFVVVYIIWSSMLNVVHLQCVPKFSLSHKNHSIREGVPYLLQCGQIVNRFIFCCVPFTCSWHGSSKWSLNVEILPIFRTF